MSPNSPLPRAFISVFIALAHLFITAFPASAQSAEKTASLNVSVLDEETLEPVIGAELKITSLDRSQIFAQGKTDSSGEARFDALPGGSVRLMVDAGAAGREDLVLELVAGETLTFESFPTLDAVSDEIVITEDRLLVDTENPNSGATTRRTSDFLQTQLAQGDSLPAVLATVPGTATNSLGQVHVRGEHRSLSLSLDGVALPQATASSITSPLDPTFVEAIEISTGMYDAGKGGQTGAILEANTPGAGRAPFAEVELRAGNYGQSELLLKAGGSEGGERDLDGWNYFVGARRSTSDLYLDAPDPSRQTLNNTGALNSVLLRLGHRSPANQVGLTLSYQGADFGVPQTPTNFEAGVRQSQLDTNLLGVLSWQHQLNDDRSLRLGLAIQKNSQRTNNNGLFTPFQAVPEAVDAEMFEEGLPFDPENPGSPYLPNTRLDILQVQPSVDWTQNGSGGQRFKAGVTANFIDSRQRLAITDPGGGGGLPGGVASFDRSIDRNALTTGAYLDYTWPLTEALTLNAGLRGETFDNGLGVRTSQLSPRFNLAYALTDEQSLKLSYNRLFQPPPIEIDVSGQTQVLPQRTHLYELAYENQFAPNAMARVAAVYKDFQDQVDIALLVPNSNIPVFAPINFARAHYKGIEASLSSTNRTGWNGFLALTLAEARPTEASDFSGPPPEYNDHDQRFQAKAGVSYRWENGLAVATDLMYASGFPQEALPEYNAIGILPYGYSGERVPRLISNVSLTYRPPHRDGGTLGAGLQVFNVFDDRSMINLFSEFSGSRFVTGRRFLFNLNAHF